MNIIDHRQVLDLEIGDLVITYSGLHLWLTRDEEYERYYFINITDAYITDGAYNVDELIEHINNFEGGIAEIIKSQNVDVTIYEGI